MHDSFYSDDPLGDMAGQIFPSIGQPAQFGSTKPPKGNPKYRQRLPGQIYPDELSLFSPGAGSGLPFLTPYSPGVSGMRMVGTGGMPSYGGLTTGQMFR